MQSISLADELTLEPAPGGQRRGRGPLPRRAGAAEQNLAGAALRAFRASTGWAAPPLRLSIVKRIPVAAGLGGGSADAAAALRLAAARLRARRRAAAARARRGARRRRPRPARPRALAGDGRRRAPAGAAAAESRVRACSCCRWPPSSRRRPSTPRPTGSAWRARRSELEERRLRAARRARARRGAARRHGAAAQRPPARGRLAVPRDRRRARAGARGGRGARARQRLGPDGAWAVRARRAIARRAASRWRRQRRLFWRAGRLPPLCAAPVDARVRAGGHAATHASDVSVRHNPRRDRNEQDGNQRAGGRCAACSAWRCSPG